MSEPATVAGVPVEGKVGGKSCPGADVLFSGRWGLGLHSDTPFFIWETLEGSLCHFGT